MLLGLLVGMGALTFFAAWAARGDGVPLAVDLLLGVAAMAVLPLLRSRPLLGGILLGVLAALSPAATPSATAGTYVVARRERLRIAIPVACASIVGHAVQALWRSVGLPLGWWLLCDVAVHAALLGWGALRPDAGRAGRGVAGAGAAGGARAGAPGRGGADGRADADRARDARHPRAPADARRDDGGRAGVPAGPVPGAGARRRRAWSAPTRARRSRSCGP